MARSSSIFYLAQQNKLGKNTALPASLSALMTPSSSISRFHHERLERVKSDVQTARSVCTSLKQLFEICHIKHEDLLSAPATTVFRNVRSFLRQRIQTEIALIGNPINFNVDTIFRITAGYDLNKDPDIVAAKELQASKRMNTFARHRMEQASLKINNFLLLLHVFEALFLVTDDGKLNGEQSYQINNFLENSIFPAEGKQFLQTCFTQVMEQQILPMELAEGKRFLRPFPPGPMLTNYLKFMARIAIYAYVKPDFSQSQYKKELEKYYTELHMTLRPQNNLMHAPSHHHDETSLAREFSFLNSFAGGREKIEEYLAHHNVLLQHEFDGALPEGVSINGDFTTPIDADVLNKFRTAILKYIKSAGFYNPEKLQFHGADTTIYISDIALSNTNLYSTSCNPNDFGMWNFAINSRFTPTLFFPERCRTFTELDQDGRRAFAIGLSGNNGIFHLNKIIGFTLSGSLEYRLLVEGFLGTISEKERRNAFMWLVQWYNQFFTAHDNTMYDFSDVLKCMGNIISLYSYLYPNDITPSVFTILEQHPYTALYHKLVTAKLFARNELPFGEELYLILFQVYINSAPEYNLCMRLHAPSALLLRRRAYLFFKNYLQTNTKFANEARNSIINAGEPLQFNYSFGALDYYKNIVFSSILPPPVSFSKSNRFTPLIDTIRRQQRPFLNYLQNSGRNVRNEIVFRILEASITPNEPLSSGIEVFRRQLLGSGVYSYDEIKRAFNISLNSRSDVLSIIAECARICKLSMYPNPAVESYDETISAFDYITFKEGVHEMPAGCKRLLLPLRLAIDAATSYSTEDKILFLFNRHLDADTEYDSEEKDAIRDYACAITKLRQLRGGSCRAGIGLSRITFTDDQKQALYDYFTLVNSSGDPYTTVRNIRAINTKLAHRDLDCFLSQGLLNVAASRRKHDNAVLSSQSRVSAFFPEESFNSPDNLDQELIAKKMQETQNVRELLAPIFAESDGHDEHEGEATHNTTNNSNSSNELNTMSSGAPQSSLGNTMDSSSTAAITTATDTKAPDNLASAGATDNASDSDDQLPPAHKRLLKRMLQLPEISRNEFKKLCQEEKLMPSAALEVINDWAYEIFDCSLLEDDDIMFFDRELLMEIKF